jgi:hypothetical protein
MFHPEFSELKTSGTLLAFTFLQIGPDSGHNYYLWQVVVSSAHPFFPAGPNPEAPARQTRAPLPSKPSCDFFRASHSAEASAFRNSGRWKGDGLGEFLSSAPLPASAFVLPQHALGRYKVDATGPHLCYPI